MSETIAWKEAAYKRAFDDELRGLKIRRKKDSSCTIAELEEILESLYILEGNNIDGRGAVKDLSLTASIAAYEQFIFNWKKEVKECEEK